MGRGAGRYGSSTAVAGIYGMNFEHMPELTLMFGICFLLYRTFRRHHWL